MVVRKKDGTPRTCVDLRKVNMATKFDCFPLARIDESLDALGGAKYLSTLDNSSAFWSILLHPEDRDKTAFGTRSHGQGLDSALLAVAAATAAPTAMPRRA